MPEAHLIVAPQVRDLESLERQFVAWIGRRMPEAFTGLKVAVLAIRMANLKGQPVPSDEMLAKFVRRPW